MPATLSVEPEVALRQRLALHGLSEDAAVLERMPAGETIETSITLGQRQIDLLTRLLDACNEADGDMETERVKVDTYWNAEAFVMALPPGVPLPDLMVHPDGEIAAEWYLARDRVLTISIGPQRSVAFAALIGANKIYGQESFGGLVPDEITHLLDRLFS
jgi:hypothetical protein